MKKAVKKTIPEAAKVYGEQLLEEINQDRDDSVAALLVMLNSGETIPKELYQIVAAIYAEVVYTADKMRK